MLTLPPRSRAARGHAPSIRRIRPCRRCVAATVTLVNASTARSIVGPPAPGTVSGRGSIRSVATTGPDPAPPKRGRDPTRGSERRPTARSAGHQGSYRNVAAIARNHPATPSARIGLISSPTVDPKRLIMPGCETRAPLRARIEAVGASNAKIPAPTIAPTPGIPRPEPSVISAVLIRRSSQLLRWPFARLRSHAPSA